MKNKKLQLIPFLIISLLITSCGVFNPPKYYYYAPDEGNELKLVEKYDLKISASTSDIVIESEEDFNENYYNFQIGYSPIKHLGLYANHFRYSDIGKESEVSIERRPISEKLIFSSGAIGGYYFFQSKKQKLRGNPTLHGLPCGILIDIYLGYGKGNVFTEYKINGISDLNFEKQYVQFGLHWQDEYVGISYTFNYGRLNYYDGILDGRINSDALEPLNNIIELREFTTRKATLKGFIGIREIRLSAGFTTTSIQPVNRFLIRDTYSFVGLELNIDDIYDTIKHKKKFRL